MRRFTDPILFFFLFLLSAVTWAIMAWRDAIPATGGRELAPMTVAVVIVIACPALAFLTVLALVRALFRIQPRGYWSVVMMAALTGAAVLMVTILITRAQAIQLGFESTMWFLGVVALGSFIAFLLSIIGAIPAPLTKEERQQAKEQKKAAKKAEAEASNVPYTQATAAVDQLHEDQKPPKHDQRTGAVTADNPDTDQTAGQSTEVVAESVSEGLSDFSDVAVEETDASDK